MWVRKSTTWSINTAPSRISRLCPKRKGERQSSSSLTISYIRPTRSRSSRPWVKSYTWPPRRKICLRIWRNRNREVSMARVIPRDRGPTSKMNIAWSCRRIVQRSTLWKRSNEARLLPNAVLGLKYAKNQMLLSTSKFLKENGQPAEIPFSTIWHQI